MLSVDTDFTTNDTVYPQLLGRRGENAHQYKAKKKNTQYRRGHTKKLPKDCPKVSVRVRRQNKTARKGGGNMPEYYL